MLAIGRGLMGNPDLMLLDEPSMGLSPILVEQIFDIIVDINAQDAGVLPHAEQKFHAAYFI